MNITTRTLAPSEVEKLLDFMCTEIFPNDPRADVESMWNNDPIKDFTGIFIAVDADQNIVSSVKVGCQKLLLCGTPVSVGIISGVGTRRDVRGQGIVGRLFDLCDNRMRERNVPLLHLYSHADTTAFYRKRGYRSTPRAYGEDFDRMYRVLKPFALGDRFIPDTEALIQLLQTKE